ncbi:hypothetical protein BCR43DRAFT_483136 [Syncephalastrum racemosum]|uniref:C2H2-type domain-containing protein n=1 Tax=Syncephalastrum racemosum TaxID=13706 RepID=A0A1X2HUP8_SYNRA|nr:hypothetical protein BCR43DRAFT_483136 [Syncephalastrum racemosum]
MLHDDLSLSDALKSMPERHFLELVLQRKRARTLSPPTFSRHEAAIDMLPSLSSKSSSEVPVIKPTVLRWTPANLPELRRPSIQSPLFAAVNAAAAASSPETQDCGDNMDLDDEETYARKDSGVSFDEPIKKKQRVMSADQTLRTRKLPDLHNTSPQSSSPSYFFEARSPPVIHPLDLRRSSTAPPSPPHYDALIKLPAITSLTSIPNPTTQLAPIHPHHDQHQHQYHPSHSHHHHHHHQQTTPRTSSISSISSVSSSFPSPTSSTVSSTQQQQATQANKRRHSSKDRVARVPGQFLCEHVIDVASGRICGQTFRRSYDLSRHQTIHLKDRPFCFCAQCGKKFTRMDALRRHERVQGHTANKRYHHHQHHRHSTTTIHTSTTHTNLDRPQPQRARV